MIDHNGDTNYAMIAYYGRPDLLARFVLGLMLKGFKSTAIEELETKQDFANLQVINEIPCCIKSVAIYPGKMGTHHGKISKANEVKYTLYGVYKTVDVAKLGFGLVVDYPIVEVTDENVKTFIENMEP